MDRFRAVIYPYTSTAGKLANLTSAPSEPVMEEGLWVLRGWIQHAVFTLDMSSAEQTLELFLFASGEAVNTPDVNL